MDATHLHLTLTHIPIVGTIIGIGILAYGQFSKKGEIKKVALVTFMVMAILTIPVFLTGAEAEETVEHIAGVSEQLIENHEENRMGAGPNKMVKLTQSEEILSMINTYDKKIRSESLSPQQALKNFYSC